MHFPFFGILSLLFFAISSQFSGKVVKDRLRLYLVAFTLTVVAGVLHEYSQIIGPRDADIRDLAKDAAGAITFLGLYMVYDKKITVFGRKLGQDLKILILAIAALLILAVMAPIAVWGGAYLYRNHSFPTICDFESFWEIKFLKTEDTVLEPVVAPYANEYGTKNNVGKLIFLKGEYPGIAIVEPYPDWSGYESFDFIVFSELEYPVLLSVRIEDSMHNENYSDRFNRTITVYPGLSDISILLDDIRKGPATRDMDMADIQAIHIFVHNPDKEFALYFDDFRLE